MSAKQETPGETVARLRGAKGWTVYQLAATAGVNRGQLARIERGERGLNLETARKVALALGVSLAVFDAQGG